MANEKRLIDATAAVDYYRKRWGDNSATEHFLNSRPSVDAVEVVHGRWEVVQGVLTPGGDPLLRCSICKSRESEHLCGIECHTVWHYCPSCGAKMDGGAKNAQT